MTSNKICPVDAVTVNEYQPRIVAGEVVILTTLFIATRQWAFMAFLGADFALRAFKYGNYSPLGQLAGLLVKRFRLTGTQIDQAPKRFAAKLGLLLCLAVTLLAIADLYTAAVYLSFLLVAFAVLESVFSICVGCWIYTLGKRAGIYK